MKVNIVEVPVPMSTTFQVFAELDREKLKQEKKVRVSFRKETKTRISTSMSFGNYRVKINCEVEGYKFAHKREVNMMSGKYEESYYFKKLKSQTYETYKEYIVKLMQIVFKDYLKLELDELVVELETRSF